MKCIQSIADMDLPWHGTDYALHERIDREDFRFTVYEMRNANRPLWAGTGKRFGWEIDKHDIFLQSGGRFRRWHFNSISDEGRTG